LRVRSAMDGDSDGNRSERSRVRENLEVSGVRENIRDRFKNENYYGCIIRPAQKKKGPMAVCRKTQPKSSPKKRRRNE